MANKTARNYATQLFHYAPPARRLRSAILSGKNQTTGQECYDLDKIVA
jgi:hypothetical protein